MHRDHLVVAGEKRRVVGGHDGVIGDVNHPGGRVGPARHLVDARRGREARPQVDELTDPGVGQHAHGADRERAVLPGQATLIRRNGENMIGRGPVHRVVVLPAQQVVVDPRGAGYRRVDARRLVGMSGHAQPPSDAVPVSSRDYRPVPERGCALRWTWSRNSRFEEVSRVSPGRRGPGCSRSRPCETVRFMTSVAPMLPLDGIMVVALEQAVAAPFATRQLADLGARVIKVERPGRGDFARDYDSAAGDGMSSWFVWLNRAKESVVLDLKADDGRRALDSLIGRADVFICNLAPAAIRRLGLEAGQLRERHPRLVACQLSAYGDTGPYADRKAYDLLVQAEAGVLAVTGSPEAPAKAGISIADIAGGMYAYSGILSALLQRGRTGRGGVVTV